MGTQDTSCFSTSLLIALWTKLSIGFNNGQRTAIFWLLQCRTGCTFAQDSVRLWRHWEGIPRSSSATWTACLSVSLLSSAAVRLIWNRLRLLVAIRPYGRECIRIKANMFAFIAEADEITWMCASNGFGPHTSLMPSYSLPMSLGSTGGRVGWCLQEIGRTPMLRSRGICMSGNAAFELTKVVTHLAKEGA